MLLRQLASGRLSGSSSARRRTDPTITSSAGSPPLHANELWQLPRSQSQRTNSQHRIPQRGSALLTSTSAIYSGGNALGRSTSALQSSSPRERSDYRDAYKAAFRRTYSAANADAGKPENEEAHRPGPGQVFSLEETREHTAEADAASKRLNALLKGSRTKNTGSMHELTMKFHEQQHLSRASRADDVLKNAFSSVREARVKYRLPTEEPAAPRVEEVFVRPGAIAATVKSIGLHMEAAQKRGDDAEAKLWLDQLMNVAQQADDLARKGGETAKLSANSPVVGVSSQRIHGLDYGDAAKLEAVANDAEDSSPTRSSSASYMARTTSHASEIADHETGAAAAQRRIDALMGTMGRTDSAIQDSTSLVEAQAATGAGGLASFDSQPLQQVYAGNAASEHDRLAHDADARVRAMLTNLRVS